MATRRDPTRARPKAPREGRRVAGYALTLASGRYLGPRSLTYSAEEATLWGSRAAAERAAVAWQTAYTELPQLVAHFIVKSCDDDDGAKRGACARVTADRAELLNRIVERAREKSARERAAQTKREVKRAEQAEKARERAAKRAERAAKRPKRGKGAKGGKGAEKAQGWVRYSPAFTVASRQFWLVGPSQVIGVHPAGILRARVKPAMPPPSSAVTPGGDLAQLNTTTLAASVMMVRDAEERRAELPTVTLTSGAQLVGDTARVEVSNGVTATIDGAVWSMLLGGRTTVEMRWLLWGPKAAPVLVAYDGNGQLVASLAPRTVEAKRPKRGRKG
jgi:hypothetical protein